MILLCCEQKYLVISKKTLGVKRCKVYAKLACTYLIADVEIVCSIALFYDKLCLLINFNEVEEYFMAFFGFDKSKMPQGNEILPGRANAITTSERHFVNDQLLKNNWQPPIKTILLGMGCFWGAERLFWSLPGVVVTSVGYAGGTTPNPTYEEVCSGRTGHTEVVEVVYDESKIDLEHILKFFWEEHDPTQYMHQGNDHGSNYRSAIYVSDEDQLAIAEKSLKNYDDSLHQRGFGKIVTELKMHVPYYYGEEYHQQYLAKNPDGYCGLQGTGVSCPIGLGIKA